MRTAIILRRPYTEDGTFGEWCSHTGFRCFTLERNPIGDHPCIPQGTYFCKLRYSAKNGHYDFGYGPGMVYSIECVPGRTDIEIHPANWVHQLLGCVAVGESINRIMTINNDAKLGVTESRATLKALMKDMEGEPFELRIYDPFIMGDYEKSNSDIA